MKIRQSIFVDLDTPQPFFKRNRTGYLVLINELDITSVMNCEAMLSLFLSLSLYIELYSGDPL